MQPKKNTLLVVLIVATGAGCGGTETKESQTKEWTGPTVSSTFSGGKAVVEVKIGADAPSTKTGRATVDWNETLGGLFVELDTFPYGDRDDGKCSSAYARQSDGAWIPTGGDCYDSAGFGDGVTFLTVNSGSLTFASPDGIDKATFEFKGIFERETAPCTYDCTYEDVDFSVKAVVTDASVLEL